MAPKLLFQSLSSWTRMPNFFIFKPVRVFLESSALGSLSRPGNLRLKKNKRLIFPTKHMISESLKFSYWLSEWVCLSKISETHQVLAFCQNLRSLKMMTCCKYEAGGFYYNCNYNMCLVMKIWNKTIIFRLVHIVQKKYPVQEVLPATLPAKKWHPERIDKINIEQHQNLNLLKVV